jgi:hypothetical protein
MRESWTLDQYVDELMNLARIEFDQVVSPDIIDMKHKMLRREMLERFSPEEMMIHGIYFENNG